MPLFTHHAALPPSIRARLELARGDQIIASAEINAGWAVATRLALYTTTSDGGIKRRPWSDVDHASLEPETATITVAWVDGRIQALQLLENDNKRPAFARALRERVQSSIVHAETVPLPGGGHVRVALRRDEAGALFSQVTAKGRVDLNDPAVAALVDDAEARVRGAAGLPR